MSELNKIPLNPIWRQYLNDEYIKNWIEIFETIMEDENGGYYIEEDYELRDVIVDANTVMFKLGLTTIEQEKYLDDTEDEDILIKIFLEIYIPHIPKQSYEIPYLKMFGSKLN
jgi:hypothetical protein